MRKILCVTGLLLTATCLPATLHAQGLGNRIEGLHVVLDRLYTDMIPLCKQMIGVGQALAGFGALFYIGSRVWKHIAAAEPIDFYPLLRPFAIGLCILLFMDVIGVINGVLQPTVAGTRNMLKDTNKAIEVLLAEKQKAIKETKYYKMYVGEYGGGDRELWMKYAHPDDKDKFLNKIGHDMEFMLSKAYYNMKNTIKEWMSVVLEVLYQAAALCINTVRTFNLIVLVILGPLVFGLSVFDGFGHTLTIWLARYINVFLWLPIANVFGSIIAKIQENMLKLDLAQIQQSGDTFFSESDIAYLIFMIIAIVGYTTIPNVASFIINAGGDSMLTRKISGMASAGVGMATGGAGMTMGAAGGGGMSGMSADGLGNTMMNTGGDMSAAANSAPYFNDNKGGYMGDKLKGS